MNTNRLIDTKQLIEKITTEDVKQIMRDLGCHNCIDKSEEHGHLMFRTICHGGESDKLYFYIESKKFHCYTHCGQMSIFDVVMKVKDLSFYQAIKFIMVAVGMEEGSFSEDADFAGKSEFDFLKRYAELNNKEINREHDLKQYSPIVLEMFSDLYYQGWIEDGITIGTMEKFGIKYSISDNAIVIPHHNSDGKLVGIRRRSLNEEDVSGGQKYMPMLIEGVWYTHQLQFNLYGLNHTKENINRLKKVVIVESEKGVMQLDSILGEENVGVALSSSNLSNYQRDMLVNMGVEEAILAMDKQYQYIGTLEYEKYKKKIINMGKKLFPFMKVSVLWDTENLLGYKDSPTDRGAETFNTLYKNRKILK